jgi:cyclomaltodextrinase
MASHLLLGRTCAPQLTAIALAALTLAGCASSQAPVTLDSAGGDAWTFDKLVTASAPDRCDEVTFTSPVGSVTAPVENGQAWARVPLGAGANPVEITCIDDGAPYGTPALQHWQQRLPDVPKAWVRMVPVAGGLELDGGASEAAPARRAPLVTYEWRAREGNPAAIPGLPARGKRVTIGTPPVDGDYVVTLATRDAAGRTDEAQALFRVTNGKARPVDLVREHAAWIDQTIVYGVAPFFFGLDRLDDVTARLDELAALGITTLWLSPITGTAEGDFGYAVTDYFRVRPDFGTEQDLRELVDAAHARRMRVIMDFVPNHVSDEHPYFRDAAARGEASPYYPFFARDVAGNPTHYFDWENLLNLDYDNPEVQNWIIEGFAWWVRRFDIDGFRADAVWGPRQRAPEFWPRWRAELKRIKPDLLLLAEASARDPYYFEEGFDAAYDWTEALGDWAWDDAFDDPARTAEKLRAAIEASERQEEPDALVFRFLNNNDTGARFVTRYGVLRARLAAAMLLTLPGLPQIYTGEDVGAAFQPYDEGPPIAWNDPYRLRPWYRQLIALRAQHEALRSGEIRFLDLPPADRLLAYVRPGSTTEGDIVVLLNWSDAPLETRLPDSIVRGRAIDLLSGEAVSQSRGITLPPYGLRILAQPGGAPYDAARRSAAASSAGR